MSPVIALSLAIGAALLGSVAGGLAVWLFLRRRSDRMPKAEDFVIDAGLDQAIDAGARAWAAAQGVPAAAPLVADKLRLLHALNRRPRERRRRWWR